MKFMGDSVVMNAQLRANVALTVFHGNSLALLLLHGGHNALAQDILQDVSCLQQNRWSTRQVGNGLWRWWLDCGLIVKACLSTFTATLLLWTTGAGDASSIAKIFYTACVAVCLSVTPSVCACGRNAWMHARLWWVTNIKDVTPVPAEPKVLTLQTVLEESESNSSASDSTEGTTDEYEDAVCTDTLSCANREDEPEAADREEALTKRVVADMALQGPQAQAFLMLFLLVAEDLYVPMDVLRRHQRWRASYE